MKGGAAAFNKEASARYKNIHTDLKMKLQEERKQAVGETLTITQTLKEGRKLFSRINHLVM